MELPQLIQYGALGILGFVLSWVGKRIVDRMDARFDALEKKVEEDRESNERLARAILLGIVKFKNPSANLSDEADQILHENDETK